MVLHHTLVVAHLFGMAAMFLAAGIELGALVFLRGGRTLADVERAIAVWNKNRVVGPVSLLLTLATGITLAAQMGAAAVSWAVPAGVLVVLIAVVGGVVTGRAVMAMDRAVRAHDADAALAHAGGRALVTSFAVRTALLAAIVVLMVVKP
jgi:hypothetical protein